MLTGIYIIIGLRHRHIIHHTRKYRYFCRNVSHYVNENYTSMSKMTYFITVKAFINKSLKYLHLKIVKLPDQNVQGTYMLPVVTLNLIVKFDYH